MYDDIEDQYLEFRENLKELRKIEIEQNTIGDYSQKYQQIGHKFKDQLSELEGIKAKF